MQTLKEKITLTIIFIFWIMFHIRIGQDLNSTVQLTIIQILTTIPYAAGFTWALIYLLRFFTKGKTPPWDRILRIFFTISMFFALFFALYERGELAEKKRTEAEKSNISVEHSPEDTPRKEQ